MYSEAISNLIGSGAPTAHDVSKLRKIHVLAFILSVNRKPQPTFLPPYSIDQLCRLIDSSAEKSCSSEQRSLSSQTTFIML